MMSGSLGEQHESTLAEREERRQATLPGATNTMPMPDGSTMVIRHGSGGAVQVSRVWLQVVGCDLGIVLFGLVSVVAPSSWL